MTLATVNAFEWLKISTPLSVMWPVTEPVLPPPPRDSAPLAVIVVPPLGISSLEDRRPSHVQRQRPGDGSGKIAAVEGQRRSAAVGDRAATEKVFDHHVDAVDIQFGAGVDGRRMRVGGQVAEGVATRFQCPVRDVEKIVPFYRQSATRRRYDGSVLPCGAERDRASFLHGPRVVDRQCLAVRRGDNAWCDPDDVVDDGFVGRRQEFATDDGYRAGTECAAVAESSDPGK